MIRDELSNLLKQDVGVAIEVAQGHVPALTGAGTEAAETNAPNRGVM
jgi:hypothetical protein